MPSLSLRNNIKNHDDSSFPVKAILLVLLIIAPANVFSLEGIMEYFCVFIIGVLLSAIELGSRYKDEPVSVMKCLPGAFYLFINGLICCAGLFLLHTFGVNQQVSESLNLTTTNEASKQVANVLYASIGSFFVMRSSFLKLGSENSQSQIDLGLNLILKKMIDIIDRQVDRDQAGRRSKDITEILNDVSYEDLSSKVHPFCLQLMQNVPGDESETLFKELESIKASDVSLESKKLAIGLQLYNIVGKKLFSSIVIDLKVNKKSATPTEDIIENEENDFESSFSDIVVEAKNKKQEAQEAQEAPLTTS